MCQKCLDAITDSKDVPEMAKSALIETKDSMKASIDKHLGALQHDMIKQSMLAMILAEYYELVNMISKVGLVPEFMSCVNEQSGIFIKHQETLKAVAKLENNTATVQ